MGRYSRYKSFIDGEGELLLVPFIPIPVKTTDKYTYWESNYNRMDLLSYKYYNTPDYGWLILQANPELGSLEYKIENGTQIRIPYPLEVTLSKYESDIKLYKQTESIY